MAAAERTPESESAGSPPSKKPRSPALRCGRCSKVLRVGPREVQGVWVDEGEDAVSVLATGPAPGTVKVGGSKAYPYRRWFHHGCLDEHLKIYFAKPPDVPRCRRPGCPSEVAQPEGAFCFDHWAELPESFFDAIMIAFEDQDAAAWKAAVKSALAWYENRDGIK